MLDSSIYRINRRLQQKWANISPVHARALACRNWWIRQPTPAACPAPTQATLHCMQSSLHNQGSSKGGSSSSSSRQQQPRRQQQHYSCHPASTRGRGPHDGLRLHGPQLRLLKNSKSGCRNRSSSLPMLPSSRRPWPRANRSAVACSSLRCACAHAWEADGGAHVRRRMP